MNKENQKIIGITGIKGFIGSHMANTLIEQGYKVVGFDNDSHSSYIPINKEVEIFWGDIRNQSDCNELVSRVDAVIHLAAEISVDKSIEDPQRVIDVNIIGTKNMLEACRDMSTPILIAGSSEEYGTAQTDIQDENHPLDGQSPYAATKVAADRLGFAYFKTYDLDVRIVRAFNVCGEGQGYDSYGAVIAIFANKINNGECIKIFGDGTQTRDYTHVSDVVEGYITILERGTAGEVYNIATGEDWSVKYIANKLQEIAGKKVDVVHVAPRKGEVDKLRGDAYKLRGLGWEYKINFDQALTRIWNNIKETE